jgi:hypothetical protein
MMPSATLARSRRVGSRESCSFTKSNSSRISAKSSRA